MRRLGRDIIIKPSFRRSKICLRQLRQTELKGRKPLRLLQERGKNPESKQIGLSDSWVLDHRCLSFCTPLKRQQKIINNNKYEVGTHIYNNTVRWPCCFLLLRKKIWLRRTILWQAGHELNPPFLLCFCLSPFWWEADIDHYGSFLVLILHDSSSLMDFLI